MAERTDAAAAPGDVAGAQGAPAGSGRWLRPRYVLPLLLLLVVATVLLTPVASERRGDPRLTTHSAESQGAAAFYELAGRLGWRTSRRAVPFTARAVAGPRVAGAAAGPLDSTAVYAVLDPPVDLSSAEAGALLAAVRRGAGLIVVLRRGSTLADSLRLRPSVGGAPQAEVAGADSPESCPPGSSRRGAIDWPGGRVYSYWLEPRAGLPHRAVRFALVEAAPRAARRRAAAVERPDSAASADAAGDAEASDDLQEDDDAQAERDEAAAAGAAGPAEYAAIIGFPLGDGHVVAFADPDWLRNDVLRVCEWNAGVQAARALEYLAAGRGPGPALVFDEYHQGFGRHPSTVRAIGRALFGDPRGRVLAQALVAALVLLAALGARAVAPRPTARMARRSPLEHVGALARAYSQIGATRLATRRLVHGIRRRHGAWGTAAGGTPRAGGGSGAESDEEFLAALAARRPALAEDAALLADSLRTAGSPRRLLEAGRAVERIERVLSGEGTRGAGRAEALEPAPIR